MALPCGTTGSLCSTFVPDRLVGLSVKHPYAIALYARLPSVLRVPLEASVTLLEATTPVKLPTKRCPLLGLGSKQMKGGISRMTPCTPERTDQHLPPILRIVIRNPMPSYSKGSRGLFVLPRVARIFTRTPISLGL